MLCRPVARFVPRVGGAWLIIHRSSGIALDRPWLPRIQETPI